MSHVAEYRQRNHSDPSNLDRLIIAIHRLADVLESARKPGLGEKVEPGYTQAHAIEPEMVTEATMAKQIGIPARTLGRYRRQGKFPGCWLKNGKHIRWRVAPTMKVWEQGIS